jgi:hypothetical protein
MKLQTGQRSDRSWVGTTVTALNMKVRIVQRDLIQGVVDMNRRTPSVPMLVVMGGVNRLFVV